MKDDTSQSSIEIFTTADNQTEIAVQVDADTVWLSLNQMAQLFDRDKSVISRHLRNIYKEDELDKAATVAKNATVQMEAGREIKRDIEYYNLNAILSVGYRVNSKQGTKFRQWATQRLKDYLLKGAAINQQRLTQLGQTIEVIARRLGDARDDLNAAEAKGLLNILTDYARSFVLLNQFDSANLPDDGVNSDVTYEISYAEATPAIAQLKAQLMAQNEATDLFGREKDEGFKSSLASVVQSFGGAYVYPSIEAQAAHLLYFVIKNHSFSDGNKRIGAFLFVWFLQKNRHLLKKSGEVKINDNALVALAILVAKSAPAEKELLIQLVINLIKES
jgi:prophage maintenance system killer protein